MAINGAEGARINGPNTQDTINLLNKLLEQRRWRRGGVAGKRRVSIPMGIGRLDENLPHGGLPTGSLIEVLSVGSGAGARTLALRVAIRAACVDGWGDGRGTEASSQSVIRDVVVVDCDGDFYPPAAVAMGLAVDRLLVVRTRGAGEALWVTEQALRCRAVASVLATRLELDSVCSRRLQLAAEGSGGVALVIGSGAKRGHTFAAVQLLVSPVGDVGVVDRVLGSEASAKRHSNFSGFSRARRCLVRVLKVREGRPVDPVIVRLSDETFDVSLSAVSVDRSPADVRRLSA